MARHAPPETTPAPLREVFAGVHAGPPTFPVQAAVQSAGAREKTRRWPLRDRVHRNRHQAKPWRFTLLIPASVGAHVLLHVVPFGEYAIPAALVALAAILCGTHWKRQARREYRGYAAVCGGYAAPWMLYATEFGLWGSAGKFSPLLFLAGWVPLSYLWWDRHATRIGASEQAALDGEPQDPFAAAWASKVEPELHWAISDPQEISTGTRYRVQLVPGQAIEDAIERSRKVASLLRISRARLTFEPLAGDEPGDSGDESVVALLVTHVQNPQHQEQIWQGPSLDAVTGLYKHGVYPDGPAFMRLFQVEDGFPHRSKNGMWSGTTGSGKSRGLAIKIAEHIRSQMFAVWYADGKGGASAPELEGHVDWYATKVDEVIRMLRAAWKAMNVRKTLVKRLNQAAFRGERIIHLGHKAFPMLQIILDEAQEFLRNKIVVKLVKAIQRMGNEVGIGVDLATQVPLLNELGGESGDGGAEVIRDTARAGNQAHYRAENNFSGTVELAEGVKVSPRTLPGGGGWCYISGVESRGAKCKTYYASKNELFGWLAEVPVVTLDEASARAAGEDYATRHQRAEDADIAPEEIDLEDLNTELAVLLGEMVPGQEKPGAVASGLSVKQAVFNVVKDNGGPMKREEVIVAVAATGKQASDSSIAQALKWWCEHSHLQSTGHGYYDLISREDAEAPAGA